MGKDSSISEQEVKQGELKTLRSAKAEAEKAFQDAFDAKRSSDEIKKLQEIRDATTKEYQAYIKENPDVVKQNKKGVKFNDQASKAIKQPTPTKLQQLRENVKISERIHNNTEEHYYGQGLSNKTFKGDKGEIAFNASKQALDKSQQELNEYKQPPDGRKAQIKKLKESTKKLDLKTFKGNIQRMDISRQIIGHQVVIAGKSLADKMRSALSSKSNNAQPTNKVSAPDVRQKLTNNTRNPEVVR
jgi:hypothetical protein